MSNERHHLFVGYASRRRGLGSGAAWCAKLANVYRDESAGTLPQMNRFNVTVLSFFISRLLKRETQNDFGVVLAIGETHHSQIMDSRAASGFAGRRVMNVTAPVERARRDAACQGIHGSAPRSTHAESRVAIAPE